MRRLLNNIRPATATTLAVVVLAALLAAEPAAAGTVRTLHRASLTAALADGHAHVIYFGSTSAYGADPDALLEPVSSAFQFTGIEFNVFGCESFACGEAVSIVSDVNDNHHFPQIWLYKPSARGSGAGRASSACTRAIEGDK